MQVHYSIKNRGEFFHQMVFEVACSFSLVTNPFKWLKTLEVGGFFLAQRGRN